MPRDTTTVRLPSQAALASRARALVDAMSARERWVYAVPTEDAERDAAATLEAQGWSAAPGTSNWSPSEGTGSITITPRADLDVTLVDARGEGAAVALGALLGATGIYAQSRLLGVAHDPDDPEAPKALATLAHMAASWDEAWRALFAVHLASDDEVVRSVAVASLGTVAEATGDAAAVRGVAKKALDAETSPAIVELLKALVARLGGSAP